MLLPIWAFAAVFVLGRLVCYLAQAAIQLFPYDVPGFPLHRHGVR